MTELGEIEDWVRIVEIPHLIVGHHDVDPLPPELDTTVGHADLGDALEVAGRVPAATRSSQHIQADFVRGSLPRLSQCIPLPPTRTSFESGSRHLMTSKCLRGMTAWRSQPVDGTFLALTV